MFLTRVLFGVLTTWCTINAITVPIDRSDVKTSPTRPSMIANGWRPLTAGYENIGANVSPSSNLERNSPHHPVLGKLHDHMQQAAAEKLKPQTKYQKTQEYTPPSILGSFSVFGHAAAKARPKPKEHPKLSTAATTHYSFLVPPPRDSFRFEIDPNRKPMLRDNEAFLRQPSFISQNHQDVNGSPFFSKGSGFTSSTTHPPSFSNNRPFMISGINGFGVVQQPLHSQHLRHNQQQQFEVQKASNTKSYFQPPGVENHHNFGKEASSESSNFNRYQNHPHSSQIPNGGAGNFYSQVDHPSPFKSSYERDPAFLVHESHEISYVTPSSNFGYNIRPSLPYENLVPPNLLSSTIAPKVEMNKFAPSQSSSLRNDPYKQFEVNNSPEESLIKAQGLSHGIPAGTYFLQGGQRPANTWPEQKTKFTTEINEVLPRKNPPAKFRQESARPNPIFGNQPEVIFIRPNVQQQFENPITSGQVHQTTSTEPEYETPESISLKHFNEQQFLLQQQLVQQDRLRLQELELQRQREQQRKQEEEVRKRQEEIRLFEQQEKEAKQKKIEEETKQQQIQLQRQELQHQQEQENQQKLQEAFELQNHQQMQGHIEQRKQQQAQELLEQRQQEQRQQEQRQQEQRQQEQRQQEQRQQEQRQQEQLRELEEQTKLHEQQFAVQQQEYNRPVANQERNPTQEVFKPSQESFESVVTDHEIKKTIEHSKQEVQPEVEPEVRPYRPKFPQRGSNRRRRPINPAYIAQATESSVQDVGTYQSLTEASAPTTVESEVTTIPIPVTLRPRTRRPGQSLKKRRPFTTTPAPEYESSSVTSASVREPETSSRYQTLDTDFSKRRRTRPTQPTIVTEETATERHYIRKRPNGNRQRVNHGEPFEAEVVTEIVRPTRIIYKDTTQWENYPESFKKKDSQEIDTSSLPSQTLASSQDMEQVSTENSQVFEFSTETIDPEEMTGFEEQIRSSRPTQSYDDEANIPLEQLFEKPEENHVEPATTPEDILVADTTTTPTTTTTSTTTTTQTPSTTTELVSSTTRQSHRIRPLKYGNATRPRFSIKDYKSRLDYKNRLSQISTTEATAVSPPGRRRFTTEKPEETSPGSPRATTSRYKYMSRVAHRPTTSSPATSPEEGDEETTTERVNRFTPKRKLNMNLYRSRVAATTTQGNKVDHEDNRQSTTRPENIFSSAIRRPRPTYRIRNQPDVAPTEEATEMAAEETSFYSSMTTPRVKEKSDDEEAKNGQESANEVLIKEEVGAGSKIEEDTGAQIQEEKDSELTAVSPTRRMQENQQDDEAVSQNESIPTLPAWTEPSRDAEDALISQRIANLTSSASKLYEPGMFKAVSPATESRVINPHFAIATDEPTLPIEAFFQVLAKKEE